MFLPGPARPIIKSAEFSFTLEYEIYEEKRILSDTVVCKFDGFQIDEAHGKTRKWKKTLKNEQNNELFDFPTGNPKYYKPEYDQIVLQNIENYKIVLGIANAEYFLGDPEYKLISEMPYIQIYDQNTGYYIDPSQKNEILNECNFKIISWQCDQPLQNNFK